MKENKVVFSGRVKENDKRKLREMGVSVEDLVNFYLNNYHNKELHIKAELRNLFKERNLKANEIININERIEILKNELNFLGSDEELEIYLNNKELIESLDYLINYYNTLNTNGKYHFEDFIRDKKRNVVAEANKLHIDLEEYTLRLIDYYNKQGKQTTLLD